MPSFRLSAILSLQYSGEHVLSPTFKTIKPVSSLSGLLVV